MYYRTLQAAKTWPTKLLKQATLQSCSSVLLWPAVSSCCSGRSCSLCMTQPASSLSVTMQPCWQLTGRTHACSTTGKLSVVPASVAALGSRPTYVHTLALHLTNLHYVQVGLLPMHSVHGMYVRVYCVYARMWSIYHCIYAKTRAYTAYVHCLQIALILGSLAHFQVVLGLANWPHCG